MSKYNLLDQESQEQTLLENSGCGLEEIIRDQARKILELAIIAEAEEFIQRYREIRDEKGHRQITRNGYLPERKILTGIGPVTVRKARVDDRALPESERFESRIVPKYLRKSKKMESFIPWLYLKGISTGDMKEALEVLIGENASGLSATVVQRLKEQWEQEFETWKKRELSGKRYAYLWADGIYIRSRGEENKMCLLVIIGANEDGEKEILAIGDGLRESELAWKEVLLDLKARGLTQSPLLGIGDGSLGFWKALEEVYPKTKHQRCWVHKTMNILDKLPKSLQAKGKRLLQEIYMAPGRKEAEKLIKSFVDLFGSKYPKAVECLKKDEEVLLTFYSLPSEHWQHIRTTNVIESTFSTIRHRTSRTNNCTSHRTALTMVYKMSIEAQKTWRKLRGYEKIRGLFEGKKYKDGVLENVA